MMLVKKNLVIMHPCDKGACAFYSTEVRAVGGPDFEEGTEASLPDEIVKQVGSCVHS